MDKDDITIDMDMLQIILLAIACFALTIFLIEKLMFGKPDNTVQSDISDDPEQ